jgi:hypothetical protein
MLRPEALNNTMLPHAADEAERDEQRPVQVEGQQ